MAPGRVRCPKRLSAETAGLQRRSSFPSQLDAMSALSTAIAAKMLALSHHQLLAYRTATALGLFADAAESGEQTRHGTTVPAQTVSAAVRAHEPEPPTCRGRNRHRWWNTQVVINRPPQTGGARRARGARGAVPSRALLDAEGARVTTKDVRPHSSQTYTRPATNPGSHSCRRRRMSCETTSGKLTHEARARVQQ